MRIRLNTVGCNLCLGLILSTAGLGARAADAPALPAPPSKPVATPAPAKATAQIKAASANDQLTLDATLVTGNRELPKVMYIVPWKKADLGNLPGKPFNTLIDEALAPVDREVFQREVSYYQVVAGKDQTATPAADTK